MHTLASGDMQFTCMPQCGVVGKGCGVYIGHVRWWDVCSVECLGMYDVGCVLFGKGTVLGMYGLDSSVSKCAQWKGEDEDAYTARDLRHSTTGYQLVMGSILIL